MKLAFTLCSINYLSYAKTLYDSLKISNPSYKLIIGLVDRNTQNIELPFEDAEIMYVDEVAIDRFQEMVDAYSIVELITAVKPFYFTYIFSKYPDAQKIIYFDPDIMVMGSLQNLEDKLDIYDIDLTPHFTVPISDSLLPTEKHVFSTGVFNLGFLAVKRSENTLRMLKWWEEKLRHQCILDLTQGYFVDQLWMNLVPAYFDKVYIDKDPGLNMAHWNLHERKLSMVNGQYVANDCPLVFFHFSHYNPLKKDQIASYHNRYNFETRPDIKPLFDSYGQNLLKNNYVNFKKVPCYFMKDESKKKFVKSVKSFLRANVPLGLKIKLSRFFK